MPDRTIRTIEQVLARAPAWVRRDFASVDAGTLVRAEEALAAMIGAMLAETTDDISASGS